MIRLTEKLESEQIERICKVVEYCLDDWNEYIESYKKRLDSIEVLKTIYDEESIKREIEHLEKKINEIPWRIPKKIDKKNEELLSLRDIEQLYHRIEMDMLTDMDIYYIYAILKEQLYMFDCITDSMEEEDVSVKPPKYDYIKEKYALTEQLVKEYENVYKSFIEGLRLMN